MAHDFVEKSVPEFSGWCGWGLRPGCAAARRRGVTAGPHLAHGRSAAREDQNHRRQDYQLGQLFRDIKIQVSGKGLAGFNILSTLRTLRTAQPIGSADDFGVLACARRRAP
jgi:hypothetical protein